MRTPASHSTIELDVNALNLLELITAQLADAASSEWTTTAHG